MSNAADQRAVRKAGQRERLAQRRKRDALRVVLATPEGRRVLWGLLEEARVFQLSFVPEQASTTAFHEGRRSLGLALLAEIQTIYPHAYTRMAQEAQSLDADVPDSEADILYHPRNTVQIPKPTYEEDDDV